MNSDMDDDIRKVRRGDRDAIERMLERYKGRLRRLAAMRLGTSLKARLHISDVLQSTYLEALKGNFRGKTEEEYANYVCRILENNIRDKRKYFDAEKRGKDKLAGSPFDDMDIVGPGLTPSAEISQNESLELFRRALERLPEDYQQVILLRAVERLGHQEIARKMNRSAGATRALLNRARSALFAEIHDIRADHDRE